MNEIINGKLEISSSEIYDFFLLFKKLDSIKQSFLMVLLHSYPKPLTVKQLLKFSGYSDKSKHAFKYRILDTLEEENIIRIERPGNKIFLISINNKNELLMKFTDIFVLEGKLFQEHIYADLLEETGN